MKTIRAFIADPCSWLMMLILLSAFVLRLYNLDYNSPFNDEASDIVVGRLGVFQGDWWTYNTAAWLAGFPYIYPPLTAVASVVGGIVGSRFLNVLFGTLTVEVIFIFTLLVSKLKHPYDYYSGVIAAAIVATSSIALYTSRLATYDAPSYYFFFFSLIPLILTERPHSNKGRLYFYAAILLLLGCLTKIIVFIYLPLVAGYSFYKVKKLGKEQFRFWLIYFCIPILAVLLLYALGNAKMLLSYAHVNSLRDRLPLSDFFTTLWRNTDKAWILWLVGSVGMIVTRKTRLWFVLTFCSMWIIVPHLITQRALWTYEKQVAMTICFLAPVIGIGIASFMQYTRHEFLFYNVLGVVAAILVIYGIQSYNDAQHFNRLWANSNNTLSYIARHIESGNKVLAESGGTAILATYDKNFPTNTVTFDWFEYHKKTGEHAYLSAVKDGYFDFIELEGLGQQGDTIFGQLHNKIHSYLIGNYTQVYRQNGFAVYKRSY